MRISIIIPTRDRAGLIGATLASALAQARPADEVVVADDGSSDGTASVVAGFGGRVRYLGLPRRGHCAARNAGLAASSGEGLVFLDSDDLLLPGALGALEGALEANPRAAVAYCRAQIVDAEGRVTNPLWEPAGGDQTGDVWGALLRQNFVRAPGCALVRRGPLEEVGGWDETFLYSEEWDVWLRLAERWEFARVGEPLFQYRVHGSNLSGSNVRMASGALRVLDKHAGRAAGDPARRAAVADARRALRDFGLAEVMDEVWHGRCRYPQAARDVAWRAFRRQPVRSAAQAALFLLLAAKRSLPKGGGAVRAGLLIVALLAVATAARRALTGGTCRFTKGRKNGDIV